MEEPQKSHIDILIRNCFAIISCELRKQSAGIPEKVQEIIGASLPPIFFRAGNPDPCEVNRFNGLEISYC